MDSPQSLGALVLTLYANGSQFFGTFQKAERDVASSMASIVNATKVMSTAVVGALAAIGTASVIQFAKFDQAMTNSLAIMENISEGTRKKMEGIARDIAKNSTTSAAEAAAAYRYLGSAGLSAAQAMAALPKVVQFAAASSVSAEQATALLTRSVAGLGLASSDAAEYQRNLVRVMDVLSTAANVADGDATDYAISLRTKVGASLRLLNKDVEEGVAVLMAYGKQGILAENAGEQLSQVLRDLQNAANDNVGVWRQMNVDVYNASGAMRPLADIVQDLDAAMAGMSDQQKALTLEMMGFQDRSVAAIKALFGSSEAIRGYERALRSAGGATQKVADEQLKSFNAQIAITMNVMNDYLIAIGEGLVPILRVLNTALRENLKGFQDVQGGAVSISKFFSTTLAYSIALVSDIFYGWLLVFKYLQMGLIALMGAFEFFSLGVQSAVLLVGGVVEGVFRGWEKLFVMTIYGFRIAMSQFGAWATEKAMAIRKLVDSFLPDDRKVGEAWYKNAQGRLNSFLAEVIEFEKKKNNAMADTKNVNWEAYLKTAKDLSVFVKEAAAGTDAYSRANSDLKAEIAALIAQGAPSDRILAKFKALSAEVKKTEAGGRDWAAVWKTAYDEVFGALDKINQKTKAANFYLNELKNAIKYTWEDNVPKLAHYNQLLEEGKITQLEYNRALMALGFTDGTNTPMDQIIFKIAELNAQMRAGALDATRYSQLVSDVFRSGTQFMQPATSQGAITQEGADLQKDYDTQMEIIRKFNADKTNAFRISNEQIAAMDKNFMERKKLNALALKDAQKAEASAVLGMAATVTGQLESMAGEGSRAAKAFFIASRAIAIAQAIINTELAASRALAEGGLFAGPAGQAVIRTLGYASVGLIAAQTIASFEGGGGTPKGPRVGGIDGKGGMLATLHPNEKVVDLNKESGYGRGKTEIIVNNYGNDEVQVEERDDGKIEFTIRKAVDAVADDIRKGGGKVSRAIETTYRTRRGA